MREIKYRIWDKEMEMMGTIEELRFSGLNTESAFCKLTNGVNRILTVGKDMVLMQATGLRDKNNREIYEGDILIQKGSKKKFKVEYITSSAGFEVVAFDGRVGREVVPPNPFRKRWTVSEFTEIIGNIYKDSTLFLMN